MKYETLLLQALFGVCLLVCVLTFGTMLAYHAPIAGVAASHARIAAHIGSTG